MIAKPIFGFGKPRLEYTLLPAKPVAAEPVPPSGALTLLHPAPAQPQTISGIKVGEAVAAGKRIALYGETGGCVIAPTAGTIRAIAARPGDFGRSYTALTLAPEEEPTLDPGFTAALAQPRPETARGLLAALPGSPPPDCLGGTEPPPKTLVVCGVDQDLLVMTQQYALRAYWPQVLLGIERLKQIAGFEEAVILAYRETIQGYGHIGARVAGVDRRYPGAHPALVMSELFGRELPAGRTPADLGYGFLRAEAVAAAGAAFGEGRLPATKILTVIPKDGRPRIAEAPVGTPIADVLRRFGVALEEGDRLVAGGPMQGTPLASADHPVQPDTDAVMVLSDRQAHRASRYPCVNCGECVRICPARIQVNLLIRYLEAGKYEEAADAYDLLSCVECGLCSFVCVSKIPIGQYIALGKHELARMRAAEALHG